MGTLGSGSGSGQVRVEYAYLDAALLAARARGVAWGWAGHSQRLAMLGRSGRSKRLRAGQGALGPSRHTALVASGGSGQFNQWQTWGRGECRGAAGAVLRDQVGGEGVLCDRGGGHVTAPVSKRCWPHLPWSKRCKGWLASTAQCVWHSLTPAVNAVQPCQFRGKADPNLGPGQIDEAR